VPHGEEGQVLFMGGSEHNPGQASDFDNTRLYDVNSNELFTIEFPESAEVDLFCCEHAFLPVILASWENTITPSLVYLTNLEPFLHPHATPHVRDYSLPQRHRYGSRVINRKY
jgi:hypothetical protein